LTNEKKLSTGSIIVAISALRFLYKVTLKKDWSFTDFIPAPKVPKKLPVILSPEEVVQFLGCVRIRKHRAILTTCYAAGLRVSEAVALTPPAIDSKRMVLRVEQGKGQKDRYTMLSPKLLEILRAWWRVERPKNWLFPGDIPGQHISRYAVEQECQKARRICKIPNRSHRIPCATLSPFTCWNKARPLSSDQGFAGFEVVALVSAMPQILQTLLQEWAAEVAMHHRPGSKKAYQAFSTSEVGD
jgi:integrase